MASSSSSTHKKHHLSAATAAPPPTPSAVPSTATTTTATIDALSHILHRLNPPTISSLPARRLSPTASTPPPLVSLADLTPDPSAALKLGYFQLTDRSVPSRLALSAESEALTLLRLDREEKESRFAKNWPVGYDGDDDEGEKLLCLDSSCFHDLETSSLAEFAQEMEKTGLAVMDAVFRSNGSENPIGKDPGRVCPLIWISEALSGYEDVGSVKFYPYVVGLHYQIRSQKWSLLADSGRVSVLPGVDSILVTIGDIAQVWSNGKLKKVRGRAIPIAGDGENSKFVALSLLLSPPLDSTVSPLLPTVIDNKNDKTITDGQKNSEESREESLFRSFSFEDYAWRVYHERLPLKDPLDRYRI